MSETEAIAKLYEAMSLAQAEFKKALKDSENPFFKSNYADLESIIDAIRPAFAKYGLAFIQPTEIVDGKLYLKTVIVHKAGGRIESIYPVVSSKPDPQSLGSAISYARRYSLSAMAGVVTSDDDDAEAAMGRPQQQQAPPPQKPVNHAPSSVPKSNLSEAQVKRFHAMAKKLNWTKVDGDKRLGLFGKKSVTELTVQEYQQLTGEMEIEINTKPDEIPF